MAECCGSGSNKAHSKKGTCPIDGYEYTEVPASTIIHHLSKPWAWHAHDETYYFCNNPDCDVVYFSATNQIITRAQLRTDVGQKDPSDSATLCYCFGLTRGEFLRDKSTKAYIVDQTKNKTCACDSRNPSGRCCLKDFPRYEI